MRNKKNNELNSFVKCMICDKPSYQAGRFITNNMNLITIFCRDHFIQLLDGQAGVSIERFESASEESKDREEVMIEE